MKWFKHMSDLSRYEDVARMMDDSGRDQLAVYGFFNLVMEHIAEKIQPGQPNDWSVTYSIARWARIVGTNKQRVRALIEKLSINRALSVEVNGDTCTVTVPQLRDWTDEYFRKSGHTPDKVAQKREEKKRTEKRETKVESALSESFPEESQRRSPPPDFEVTEVLQEWAATNYPSVPIEKETAKFKNHEYRTARSDWSRAWKFWIIRAAEHQEKTDGSADHPSRNEQLLKLAELYELERRPNESELDFCNRIDDANQRRIQNQG